MRKLATLLVGAMIFVTAMAGTAIAAYTGSPPPEASVEGVGGGAGETAFTGGDVSSAVIVALTLVMLGTVVLLVARRRTATD
ncbi:MAG TPA: hypothetical protein VFP41_01510 [Actinomycetota bacterium]|nr:hypothetical protein [Actinomycetota bacterium]